MDLMNFQPILFHTKTKKTFGNHPIAFPENPQLLNKTLVAKCLVFCVFL